MYFCTPQMSCYLEGAFIPYHMALILNIETSTRVCSVALCRGGQPLATRHEVDTLEHARVLHPFIREVLQEGQSEFQQLDAVAVSQGPGSYTGLRIGVSAAKGICLALSIPLLSVSTLQAMALSAIHHHHDPRGVYIPMIDARRMEVYTTACNASGEILEPVSAQIMEKTSLDKYTTNQHVYYFGCGAEKCQTLFSGRKNITMLEKGTPSAAFMNPLAQKKYFTKAFENTAWFVPFYLKDFVAGKPKVKGLK